MIRTTLSKLVNAVNSGALARLASKELPIKTAFKLRNLIKQTAPIMENYETSRVEMLKKVDAKLNEQTQIWDFPTPEARAAFDAEFKELVEVDIEINASTLKLANFNASISFTTMDLDLLDWLIIDVDQEQEPEAQTAAAAG
jgi:hypothetical protein